MKMRAKLLLILMMLLVIGGVSEVFAAASIDVQPTKVPKGAYYNTTSDNNIFWQRVTITLNAVTDAGGVAGEIVIALPSDLDIPDLTTDGDFTKEISFSYSTVNSTVYTLDQVYTMKDSIYIDHSTTCGATDQLVVMFPVILDNNPGSGTGEYTVAFDKSTTLDITTGNGVTITYVDPSATAIQLVAFTSILSANNDSTSTEGEVYPTTAAAGALYNALPDLVINNSSGGQRNNAAAVTGTHFMTWDPLGGTDVIFSYIGKDMNTGSDSGNESLYKVWASKQSNLAHVSVATGAIPVTNYATSLPYDTNEDDTGSSRFATGSLEEGTYYFYITSKFTGDYSLSRSDGLVVRHWPNVDIVAFDRDGVGNLTTADDADVTLDSGNYYGYDNTISGTGKTTLDLYVSVDDFDDNANVSLFYSTNNALTTSDLTTTTVAVAWGDSTVVTGLTGATALADTLIENQEDQNGYIVWNWDVGSASPPITAGTYTVYAVANDGKNQHILGTYGLDSADGQETVKIIHSPYLVIDALTEYDLGTDVSGESTGSTFADVTIDPAQTDVIMLSWGKSGTGGDVDLDDSATIEFYLAYAGTATTAAYGTSDASTIRTAANTAAGNTAAGVHRIASGLSEDAEAQSSSYYEWNLAEDFASTGWYPYNQRIIPAVTNNFYHLYAIIDEGGSGTARVICLGDTGILSQWDTVTTIEFDIENPQVRLYDPPAQGATIGVDDVYRFNFNALDLDADSQVGVFLVKDSATSTILTSSATISTFNATGIVAYALNSANGSLASTYTWLSDNTDKYYDFTLRVPGASYPYTQNLFNENMLLADGDYWAYIGVDNDGDDFGDGSEVVYKSPGKLTIVNSTSVPTQNNITMSPGRFTASVGDTTTINLRAVDKGNNVDLINLYIAVDKSLFDIANPSSAFTDPAGFGTLLNPQVVDDSTGGRWILKATVYETGGAAIGLSDTGSGDTIASFKVVCKGTNNAIDESGVIYFVSEPGKGWDTTFYNNNVKLPFSYMNTNVSIVKRAIVEGIIKFQGRDDADHLLTFYLRKTGSYVMDDDSKFISTNDGANADTTQAKMDSTLYAATGVQYLPDNVGKFRLLDIPTGRWDLIAAYPRYLSLLKQITVSPGIDTLFVNFGTLQGGDAFGYTDSTSSVFPNNTINADDITRIADAFGSTPDSSKWSTAVVPATGGKYNYKWADINEDNEVDAVDLAMATGNWTGGSATTGAQPVYAKAALMPVEANLNSLVELVNTPEKLEAGKSYTLQVRLSNAGDVRGYFVDLAYNKNALSFEEVVKGDFISGSSYALPYVREGLVGIANTVYGKESYSGEGVLAEITFTSRINGAFSSSMLGITETSLVNSRYFSDTIVMASPSEIGVNDMPVAFELQQNFPNPFNPMTTISFAIPEASGVSLKVYDILGRHVKTLVDGSYAPGNYSVVWDATDIYGRSVSAGVYFYTINAGVNHTTQRMLLLK
ncbi:T9SS type A sorting domain-containing protein [Candidatus Latescibacterota bacterium]